MVAFNILHVLHEISLESLSFISLLLLFQVRFILIGEGNTHAVLLIYLYLL